MAKDNAQCRIDEENLQAAQENLIATDIVAFAAVGAVILAAGETAGWALLFLDATALAAVTALDAQNHSLNAAQLQYALDRC